MLPRLWSPFERLSLVENRIDDLLDDFARFHPVLMWRPSIDVAESDKRITVKAEVPGREYATGHCLLYERWSSIAKDLFHKWDFFY